MNSDKGDNIKDSKGTVFYDDRCYLCSYEIKMLKKCKKSGEIDWVDISEADFEGRKEDYAGRAKETPMPFEKIDFKAEMVGIFDGKVTIGVATFAEMYSQLFPTFGPLFKLASVLPVLRQCLQLGYYIFAYWIRPNLPQKAKKE